MSDPIQDIARQLGITTFGDGLLTKIRETIDLLQSDANNLMQYKEVAAELEAELAALKAKAAVPDRMAIPKPIWKDARHPYGDPLNAADIRGAELFNLAIDEVLRLNSAAAPAQPQSDAVPDAAMSICGDTGCAEVDSLIGRLMSSDPDFEDCTAAAALLRRLFLEEIRGPKGHATWKDAAIAERVKRVAMRPSPPVVVLAREGLEVYSGPNMNEHKVCAEIVRLAAISDASPAQPQSDCVMVPRELLERVVKTILFTSQEDSHYDACTELRALLGGDQPAPPQEDPLEWSRKHGIEEF